MYQRLTNFDSLDGISGTAGYSLNKWPKFSKAGASISTRLLNAGDHIQKVFDQPISFRADNAQKYDFSILRLFIATPGVVYPAGNFLLPQHFTFSVELYLAGRKIVTWLLPAVGTEVTSYDFDLAPLIGNDDLLFDRIRVTALADNAAYVYLAGLYLTDSDVEHSMKQAIQELLHEKIDPFLCLTKVRNDLGADKLILPEGAPLRQDLRIKVDQDIYKVLGYTKTEDATIVDVANAEDGVTLLGQYPPGTLVSVSVPATYTDIADADNIYPTFYIQGSELPARNLLGAESSLVFPRSSYVDTGKVGTDGKKKYFVGVQTPDKAYNYALAIHIYANTLDIANVMRKFLSALFDEDGFIDIAGEPHSYVFKGIDGLQEWDSVAAMPHAILRLELSFSENLSVVKYVPFGLAKKVDFEIAPFLLLKDNNAG
jgi:hypothetical protein